MRTNEGAAAGGASGAGGTAAGAGADGEGGSAELEFLTPGGEAHRTMARLHAAVRIPGREPLAARTVTLGDGRRVLQYRLPFSEQGDNAAYGALERQVGAAVALERRYGSERFGEVFTRLVGFDLEAAEPYVLYRAPEGKPLAGRQGTLTVAEQQRLIAQLVLAVRLLEEAGLVHREITPDTVRWDGTHVRLAEPYGAQRIGEPREPFGAAPWAPPEQREGTGTADTRDDLWAVGRLVYFLLSGRPGPAAEPPHDLGEFRRLAAPADSGLFDPRAVNRPRPSDLMRLLQVPDPLSAPAPADPLSAGRAEFDAQRAKKRKELGTGEPPQEECYEYPTPRRSWRFWLPRGSGSGAVREPEAPPPPPPPAARPTLCPYCLLPVEYDETRLVTLDGKRVFRPLDLSRERRPMHRQDALRQAYQSCPHAPADAPHHLPVPFLTNGEPLTVALVGSSAAGKTHLLAAMLGEIEQGGLEPYGLKCLPLNPDAHREFIRERVQRLHRGKMLESTGQMSFAHFADGLLVTGGGVTRPVLFFDLAGEDLAQNGEVTSFLMGVGAFIFVLDPLRALRLPALDPVRSRTGLHQRELGDEAFTTVLNRVPRIGPCIDAPAAVALNKSDLIRFDPSVDRWLSRAAGDLDEEDLLAESRDAYAFVAHHGNASWLKPFDDCARCTLHFVAATGAQARGDVYPHGIRPRRVLTPLLSVFAMSGLLPGARWKEVGT
ncbi:hypothetical protein LIX60_20830 [Streptomyces sp. S07_1.15]|uniref:hypothetical protein n=1 Tax=Streptomyces sp. S07_1.15 TaxID=2873925 RepID=UPI001D13AEC7|nr:hypothetical protein [Streptomyces sp. S07_1.15]MCC3653859.1 hypothetical protein [Streptomyces sp. S07_1.15]